MTTPPESAGAKQLNEGAGQDPASFYKSLMDNLHDGVYFVNRANTITYWNRGAEHVTGYSQDEAVGRCCSDNFLMHVDERGCALCLKGCPTRSTMADGQIREAEIYLRHKHGHRVPVSVRVAPIKDNNGHIIGAIEVFTDVTAKKHIERRAEELECLAHIDALTGVANRRFVELKLQQALQEVQQFGRGVGLLMIDIDRFKNVNDTWGHQTGDLVLQAASNTLVHNLRPTAVVGRWGGEEFLIILSDMNLALLENVAERCRMLIAETRVRVGTEDVRVTVSAGATLLLASDTSQSAIIRADALMYRSKAAGRNCTTVG